MQMEQDETFGPFIAMSRFDKVEEAIARANDSQFGLGTVVFGNQGAKQAADQLEAGMVAINQGVGGNGDSP
ncbi:MAG: succinate-semialdehyde dehydrogenase/glutarate-semialdehyde dehydrogenase [Oceanospirillaceae bacterium]|jgi:succinate-semialdehyde dehydrogenase/glutarate-semialdehyde dehydrogenase